jgi:hypothetical protein
MYLVSVVDPGLATLTSAPEYGDTFRTSDKRYTPFASVVVDAINEPVSKVSSATLAPATSCPPTLTTPDSA